MKVFMRGSFEQSLAVTELDHFDADRMVDFMRRVIEGAAAEGKCVIVGRGAPHFLREREDAFHVFVFAPLGEKIRRLCESGKSEAQANEEIARIDHERVLFIRKYFGKEWPVRQLYNLMINSKVGDDVVVRTILNAMTNVETRAVSAGPGQSGGEWS